jgi:hypothetical protein
MSSASDNSKARQSSWNLWRDIRHNDFFIIISQSCCSSCSILSADCGWGGRRFYTSGLRDSSCVIGGGRTSWYTASISFSRSLISRGMRTRARTISLLWTQSLHISPAWHKSLELRWTCHFASVFNVGKWFTCGFGTSSVVHHIHRS